MAAAIRRPCGEDTWTCIKAGGSKPKKPLAYGAVIGPLGPPRWYPPHRRPKAAALLAPTLQLHRVYGLRPTHM